MVIFTPNTVIRSTEINSNFDELKTKTDYLTAPDSAWIEVGSGGTAPAFANSWVNYDTTVYNSAGFYKDAFGFVTIKGLIKNGTIGSTAQCFTLPVGYRPIKRVLNACISNSAIGRLDVDIDGKVITHSGNNAWYSLDNCRFKAQL